jgi:hypothetical protein
MYLLMTDHISLTKNSTIEKRPAYQKGIHGSPHDSGSKPLSWCWGIPGAQETLFAFVILSHSPPKSHFLQGLSLNSLVFLVLHNSEKNVPGFSLPNTKLTIKMLSSLSKNMSHCDPHLNFCSVPLIFLIPLSPYTFLRSRSSLPPPQGQHWPFRMIILFPSSELLSHLPPTELIKNHDMVK